MNTSENCSESRGFESHIGELFRLTKPYFGAVRTDGWEFLLVGLTSAAFKVRGPKRAKTLSLIVDTRSVYTWVPSRLLKDAGVAQTETVNFTTIEGRRIRRAVGEALLEYDGARRHCMVVFAKPGDASVLGVTALENLALEVDPSSRKLRRSKALAAY